MLVNVIIRFTAFPCSNPLIWDWVLHLPTKLLYSSCSNLSFLKPLSKLGYFKENGGVCGASMTQPLPARLSSTLYGFPFSPPHLPLTVCLLSTKGRLCQTNPIAFFDKIADFLVKGNALDTIYLDFSNAFDMGQWSVKLEGMGLSRIRGWVRSPLKWGQNWEMLRWETPTWKMVPQESLLDWILLNIFTCDCGGRKEGRKEGGKGGRKRGRERKRLWWCLLINKNQGLDIVWRRIRVS